MGSLYGIAPARPASGEYTSSELVQDFLYYTADLSLDAASKIAGVSTATLTRWRMMGARQLRSDVRDRLMSYVGSRDKDKSSRQAA